MKAEIESIFRVGAGDYILDSSKYFVKIKGVRVPLDVFTYDGIGTAGITTGAVFSPSQYYSYTSPPIIDPSAGMTSYLKNVFTSKTSYVPSETISYAPSSVVSSTSLKSMNNVLSSSALKNISSSIGSSSKISSSAVSSAMKSSPISSVSLKKSSKVAPSLRKSPVSKLLSSRKSYVPSIYKSYKLPYRPYYKPSTTPRLLKFPILKKIQKPLGEFSIFGRRFGKFKIIGYGRTPLEAVGIGKQWARKTLGATFKIEGLGKTPLKLPSGQFYTKYSKKHGKLFIQKSQFRLSFPTEVKEIQFFKKIKKGKNKIF